MPTPYSFSFVLVDATKTIDPKILAAIAADCTWQAQEEVQPQWGVTATMRVGKPDSSDVQPTEIAMMVQLTLPDAPGAEGYHATLTNGAAVAYFALSTMTSLTTDDNSLSECVSHEMIETMIDPGANRFATKSDGQTEQALEGCDRVQGGPYPGPGGCQLANFLYQAAFDPGAPGPYDRQHVLHGGEDRTAEGYEIDATLANETSTAGEEEQRTFTMTRKMRVINKNPAQTITPKRVITLHGTENLKPKHQHWSSRLSRRQRRVAGTAGKNAAAGVVQPQTK